MIDGTSPAMRKVLAVTILLLAALFSFNFLIRPGSDLIRAQLEALEDMRFQHDRLRAIYERRLPAPGDPVPSDLYIRVASAERAEAELANVITRIAQNSSVSVEQANIVLKDKANPHLLAIDLSISGTDLALAAFVNEMELHRPVVRFAHWSIIAAETGQGRARLSGRALATWSDAR